ncbi:hypothetical protein LIER_05625 [Lithospermum erythrorhizon]|uniref:Uncharacterized protein n=1 Tax=Lithospermum erythrorhizon TaxID=34254 RepID=A0AAV3P5Z2_LITER
MTLDDYYNKLTGLFDELSRLKPPHSCSCGKCTCGVVARYEKDREEERLHQFFMGIDVDLYGVVRSNLLSRLPMPYLDEAYNTFLQDENSKSITHKKDEPDSFHAFAISSDRPLSRYERSKLSCTHCRQTGHDNSSCFKLHGYPPWWEERRQGKSGVARNNTLPPTPAGCGRGVTPQVNVTIVKVPEVVGPSVEPTNAKSL